MKSSSRKPFWVFLVKALKTNFSLCFLFEKKAAKKTSAVRKMLKPSFAYRLRKTNSPACGKPTAASNMFFAEMVSQTQVFNSIFLKAETKQHIINVHAITHTLGFKPYTRNFV